MTAQQLEPSDRPRLHFTPRRGWMNDPNGLIHHSGRWHLFFQHNPHGTGWGHMSWGHASSTDLVHWHEEPVAILHDRDEDVFSGSVVAPIAPVPSVGSAAGGLVAIYTSAATAASTRPGRQAQAVATSADGGATWTKRAGGPVLDRCSTDFRDPHVFRWSDARGTRWVMVAVEAVERAVVISISDDLVTWTFASRFAPAIQVDGIWECPDLFPLRVAAGDQELWVLLLSVGNGHPNGGSGMLAFVGDFDGSEYVALAPPRWLDWGRDCYAGITFTDAPDGRRIMIAWMSNWQYAGELPDHGWRGAMTIPRELALERAPDGTARLTQRVPQELLEQASEVASLRGVLEPGRSVQIAEPGGSATRIVIDLQCSDGDVEIRLGTSGATLAWSSARAELVLERPADPGFTSSSAFASRMTVPLLDTARGLHVELVLDADSVEVLADRGATAVTALLAPEVLAGGTTLTMTSGAGELEATTSSWRALGAG